MNDLASNEEREFFGVGIPLFEKEKAMIFFFLMVFLLHIFPERGKAREHNWSNHNGEIK